MKTSAKYLIVISLIVISIFGCKKSSSAVDTIKPVISISKPTAGQIFTAGSTIAFQATFSDNENLKSYEISINQVATGGLILKIVPTSVPFSYLKSATSFTAGTKQQEINLNDIVIPLNTATTFVTPGKYKLKVVCVDGSNNSFENILEININ